MSQTNQINWGIIGCGNVTELKSGPAFNKVPDSALVAVMRRDAEKAADYAQRHGVPKWYSDADALINDPDINAIYVATPPHRHEAYAVAAMQAGKPVYVEKPMSVDLASCMRMREAAEKTGTKLCIAHYRRALPMFLHIRQMIAEKKIGEVRTVRISLLQPDKSSVITQTANNWRVDPAVAGAGLFYDLAPHQLDLVQYFFGEPLKVLGLSANQAGLYKAEDVVSGMMHLPGNILFTGQWCYTVDPLLQEDIFEINGSKGRIRFSVFHTEVYVLADGKEETLSFLPPAHIQQPMITKVVRYFLGEGGNPCAAQDAIGSMRVMERFAYG
ncbi:Gfo/Idh/MocA family protein [Sediminibacterium soli]|uniref:Gfo/Idh/MocA family protein n=1 Tax=Sediminibacterium soli TaxID=2698829 RepID=UPI00137983D5|nr:Gfo/Idh/MocA family oxidoreductase [Sediminibacterium soli]NCI45634.1 Gfo/Idh/MocA family oxidoreductase [Sediminibacterium soli]